jgi:1,4-dihydroxy-2-naphthoyl-CoA hydrolase
MDPLSDLPPQTLLATLGIEVVEATKERVVARMPVGPRVHQPFGVLHGGASVALAETVASIAAWLQIDRERETVMGIEINANHVRAKRDGEVTATASAVHVGRRTQVWEVRVVDEEGRLVCISRCTLAVVPRDGG